MVFLMFPMNTTSIISIGNNNSSAIKIKKYRNQYILIEIPKT